MYAATSLRPRTQTTRFLLAFSPISLTDIIFQWLKFVWSSSLWLLLLGWSYKLVTSKQTMFVVLLPWDLRKNWLGIQYRVRRKYGSWELCERNDNSRWKKKTWWKLQAKLNIKEACPVQWTKADWLIQHISLGMALNDAESRRSRATGWTLS